MTINNNEFQQQLRTYSERSIEVRSQWYSPAANAYDKVRPRYPKYLIQQGLEQANLSTQSTILEIGCGPGTATYSLAQLGASITAIEPNPHFYHLASDHFANYSHVTIQNSTFESFPTDQQFDAVIAATSFHWISPDVSYQKSAQLLKEHGSLILFWNKQLQPSLSIYEALRPIYEAYAPQLLQYEDAKTQKQILESLGSLITESGYFHPVYFDSVETETVYSREEYCLLLKTYSPYLQLEAPVREILLTEISQMIQSQYAGKLPLTYRSAFHQAQKI